MKILLVDDQPSARAWRDFLESPKGQDIVMACCAGKPELGAEEELVHAAASQIELAANELPAHIQWMPPGLQVVQPMGFDEPFEMNVTALIAQAADRQLQQLRSKAAAGSDAQPYGDFNHKDEERAYLPKRFWWGGADPKTGGVRVDVEWTGAGAKAVKEGALCCNSPSWRLSKTSKAFLGITHNVGGLVPRGAFHSIQAFAKAETLPARNGGAGVHQQQHQPKNTMTPEQEKQLADLNAAVGKLSTQLSEVVTGMAKATAETGKIVSIETELKTIKDGQVAQAKASALALVEEHGIRAGRIGAQDTDRINRWVNSIVADAKALDDLKLISVNPALKTIVANAKAGATTTTTTDEHEFVAKAKAYGKEKNITDELEAQAKFAATADGAELYAGYRAAMTTKQN